MYLGSSALVSALLEVKITIPDVSPRNLDFCRALSGYLLEQ